MVFCSYTVREKFKVSALKKQKQPNKTPDIQALSKVTFAYGLIIKIGIFACCGHLILPV